MSIKKDLKARGLFLNKRKQRQMYRMGAVIVGFAITLAIASIGTAAILNIVK